VQCTIVSAPDPTQPFVMRTDASDYAIGAVLTQGSDKAERVIAYESRKLNVHEINYPTHDKELLAVVHALRVWRHYLLAAPHPVQLQSDNTPVVHFLTKKDLTGRQARWSELISEYNLALEHIPGQKNDSRSLSRVLVRPR
jgi:ribonuclease HI